MTQNTTNKIINGDASSWWVWLCWLEREGYSGFVYGCAAQCFRPPKWTHSSQEKISNSGQLKIHELTLNEESFRDFHEALNSGVIKPD